MFCLLRDYSSIGEGSFCEIIGDFLQKRPCLCSNGFWIWLSEFLHPQKTADLVTFTEEILNGKFIFCVVLQLNVIVVVWGVKLLLVIIIRDV